MFRNPLILIGLFVALISIGLTWDAVGQEDPAQDDPVINALDAQVAQFLEGVSIGQTQSAYQELLAGSQLLQQTEAVKALVEKTNQMEAKYGRYHTFTQIAARHVESDIVLLKYLYKCENFPVVWYFTFYRTPAPGELLTQTDNWRAVTVRFDTELELLAF